MITVQQIKTFLLFLVAGFIMLHVVMFLILYCAWVFKHFLG